MDKQTVPVKGPAVAPPESPFKMVVAMGAIGTLAAVLLVFTYLGTLPAIERNRAEALEQAIFQVLPGASRKEAFYVVGDTLRSDPEAETVGTPIFAGYDDEGQLIGVAIPAQGPGFQDVLKVIYGYDPACECVVGFKVLESKETPGLGDKIETDPAFVANFEALDLRASNGVPDHPLELVKPGQKTEPWQVEGITGATISARAVTRILRASAGEHVQLIEDN
ncbi:MAG: FMN-binding protein, partial [Candidatus Competibacterales bacterium]|nr:FMN-binding protein [Candidatus Competibacterales bacterium]